MDSFNKLSLIGHFSVLVKFYNNCVRVGLLNMNMIIEGVTGNKEEGSGNIFTFGLTKRREMLDRLLQVCQTS